MSKSTSSPTNTTQTQTDLTTKNLNVSGNTGTTLVGGEGGSLAYSQNLTDSSTHVSISTDLGAVQAGTALSQSALDTVAAVNNRSLDTVRDISGQAITATGNAYGDALHTVSEQANGDISIISNLATKFGTALSDFTSQEQTQLGNTVSALNSTYTANNTSANQQVINATEHAGAQLTDAVKYIALAAIAGTLLYVIMRKH